MTRTHKTLFILSNVLVGVTILFLRFSKQGVEISFDTSMVNIWELLWIIFLSLILSIKFLRPAYPVLDMFYKPLWGFKKVGGKNIDTSIEKHPYIVSMLFLTILICIIYTFLIIE